MITLAIAWPLLRAGVQELLLATKDAEVPRWRPERRGCSDENVLTGSIGQLGRALRTSLRPRSLESRWN